MAVPIPSFLDEVEEFFAFSTPAKELEAVRERFLAKGGIEQAWLVLLLQNAAESARRAGPHDFATVLNAIAGPAQACEPLPKGKGSLVTAARQQIRKRAKNAVLTQPEFVRALADRFKPIVKHPDKIEDTAEEVAWWMIGFAPLFFGPPATGWSRRIVRECVRTYERNVKHEVKDEANYARAALRGWGLSEARARDAVKSAGL